MVKHVAHKVSNTSTLENRSQQRAAKLIAFGDARPTLAGNLDAAPSGVEQNAATN